MITILKAIFIAVFAISILLMFIFPPLLIGAIPLGALVGITFCFHPDTIVGNKTINEVNVGDVISGSKVTGVFHMNCLQNINLYNYNGIIVSGLHIVNHNSKWMYVQDTGCPLYTGTYPKFLVCLNTDSNKIQIKDVIFSDYEEVNDTETLSKIEKLIWGKNIDQTYSCGLHPTSTVTLSNGKIVTISSLKLGDSLIEGKVLAIVKLDASNIEWYNIDDCIISGNQALQKNGNINLAKYIGKRQELKIPIAYQIFLENNNGLFLLNKTLIVRDYPDTHNPKILTSIQNLVLESLNKKVEHF
jgi:hypothetical protein